MSGGVVNNSIHISVSYRAPKQHTTAWFVRYQDKDTYMTGKTIFGMLGLVHTSSVSLPKIICQKTMAKYLLSHTAKKTVKESPSVYINKNRFPTLYLLTFSHE